MATPSRSRHWWRGAAIGQAGPCCWPPAAARARALAADLRARGFTVVRRVVYAAIPVATLPDAARDAFARRRS